MANDCHKKHGEPGMGYQRYVQVNPMEVYRGAIKWLNSGHFGGLKASYCEKEHGKLGTAMGTCINET